MRFGIFVAKLWYFGKDRLGVAFKDSQLKEQSRVEHHVGFLLEGVNPFLFAPHDGGATGDGLSCGIVAVFVVADYTAEEADIDGGNPIVVVDIDSGEGRNKDFVGCLTGDIGQ